MSDPQPSMPAPVRRRKHLLDPDNPRPTRDRQTELRRLTRVQQWVMSSLVVTTILHLSLGLMLASHAVPEDDVPARVGLNLIGTVFAIIAIGAGLAIHRRSPISPWLLLGLIPGALGLWFALR